MATRTLTIDKEFAGLCPNLTDEESAHLEASIEADGCRDEIVVWANHKDTILDGHHRYKICERLGKTFKTTALRFESREECIEWIIVNQLGRRNLTDEQKAFLIGKRQQAEKKAEGPPQKTDAKVAPLRTANGTFDATGAGGHVTLPPANVPTLSDIGITKRESTQAQMLACLPRARAGDTLHLDGQAPLGMMSTFPTCPWRCPCGR